MRFILISLICCAMLIGSALCLKPAEAQVRGHGGPIRALAVSADGARALSGSFDTSAIRWSLRRNAAEQVLRLHESAVNAVAILKGGRAVTASEDARIAIWTPGRQEPDAVL
jgi:cytochrome c